MDSHMCSTSTGVIHPGQYYILFWKQENTSLTHCYFISSGPYLSRCCRRKSKCCIVSFSLTSCPTDYIQHIGSTLASLSPCSIPQRLYRQAQSLLRSLLPWSNIASKTGIQYSRTMWHSMVSGAYGDTSPTLLNIKLIHLTGFVFLSVFQSHRCSRQSSPVHAEMYTHTHILLQLSTPCVTHRTSGSTCIWPFTYFSAHWFTGFVSLQRHEMCSVVFTLTDSRSYSYKPLFSWFNQILYSPIYTYHTVPFVLQL